jgi:hypothetical protein
VDEIHFNERTSAFECQARIPNLEVSSLYYSTIQSWLTDPITAALVSLLDQLYENFVDKLHQVLVMQYDSALFAKQEDSVEAMYHSLLLVELNKDTSRAQYAVLTEEYSGQGIADILVLDHHRKILVPLELKRAYQASDLEKRAEEAVQQAITKKYGQDPKYQDYTHHPAVGISFYGTRLVLKIAESDQTITR